MITCGKDGIHYPNRKYLLSCDIIPKEPKSVKTTLRHSGWKQAMADEIKAHIDQNTFELVPRTPHMAPSGYGKPN